MIRKSIPDSCIMVNCKIKTKELKHITSLCPQYSKKVIGYIISVSIKGTLKEYIVTGPKWSKMVNEAFKELKKGDKINFENIKITDFEEKSLTLPIITVELL